MRKNRNEDVLGHIASRQCIPHVFENPGEWLLGLYSQRPKSSQLPKRVCFDFTDFIVMQVTEIAIRISSVSKALRGVSDCVYDPLQCSIRVRIWDRSNRPAITKIMMLKHICI